MVLPLTKETLLLISQNQELMAKTSPIQRSLALLKAEGYTVAIAEKFNFYIKIRQDLFGFLDLVAIHPDKKGVLGIQTTSGSNLAARIKKAQALPAFDLWLKSGNKVEFHGWRRKGARGRRK